MRSKRKKPSQTKSPPKTILDLVKYVVFGAKKIKSPQKATKTKITAKLT